MDWISVKDMMPELNQSVLVFGHDEWDPFSIKLCKYEGDNPGIKWISTECCHIHGCLEVTYWMPLPSEPKD